MPTKIIAIAAALSLGLSGAALAQSSTGKGGTGGTVDPSGPVRNNTGNGMERSTGGVTGSTGTTAPGAATPGTAGSTAPGPGGTMGGGAGSAGGGNSAAGR